VLEVLRADDYLNRIYRSESGQLAGFFVGYYGSQRHGSTIHSPLNCLPGAGWQPVETNRVALVSAEHGLTGGPVMVNRVVVQKGEERQLVLYWYQTKNRVVASEYWSKIFLVTDAFTSRRTDAALVRVVVPIDPRSPNAEAIAAERASAFAGAALPQVRNILFKD
jgi:EpsI family protein